ncbi:3533_t:CDS:2 [Entrophospora sp. SA101]|nr:3533_t:CDS:2 [Entrophospora sp. SA101]
MTYITLSMPRGSNQYKKYFYVLPDKPNDYNHLEWLNWVADNDTKTIIENELYNNGEGFINTSSKEINNLQNLSTPNKKKTLGIGQIATDYSEKNHKIIHGQENLSQIKDSRSSNVRIRITVNQMIAINEDNDESLAKKF